MEKLSYKSALLVLLVLLVLRGESTAHAVIITEFLVPTANAGLRGITAGPDGNLWFTEAGSDKIGRITPAGVITEFTVPGVGSQPSGIAVGAGWQPLVYGGRQRSNRTNHHGGHSHRVHRPRCRQRPGGHHDRARWQPLVHPVQQ